MKGARQGVKMAGCGDGVRPTASVAAAARPE
jgi:hypothetical protein